MVYRETRDVHDNRLLMRHLVASVSFDSFDSGTRGLSLKFNTSRLN
jgi:hypothetical protein